MELITALLHSFTSVNDSLLDELCHSLVIIFMNGNEMSRLLSFIISKEAHVSASNGM
jgi:hypothetical protein